MENLVRYCVLRQREEWIRFSHSNEDTKDEERKGWVSRQATKCGAKRQARTCPRAHARNIVVWRSVANKGALASLRGRASSLDDDKQNST
jgi:hypothetical protein